MGIKFRSRKARDEYLASREQLPAVEPEPVQETEPEHDDDLHSVIVGNAIDGFDVSLYDGTIYINGTKKYGLSAAREAGSKMIATERKRRNTKVKEVVR